MTDNMSYAEKMKDYISPHPRWDIAGHPDVGIHCAIADLVVQVARIANVLEYVVANIDPKAFPTTDNRFIHGEHQS